MTGISLEAVDGTRVHEWSSCCCLGSLKRPCRSWRANGVEVVNNGVCPLRGGFLPVEPCRKELLGGTGQGDKGNEEVDEGSVLERGEGAHPAVPAVQPLCGVPGSRSRGHSDPAQADGLPPRHQHGQAHTENGEGKVFSYLQRCPDLDACGRNECHGDDQAQAEGSAGLSKIAVQQDAPETGILCTGSFHPLLWPEGIPEGSGLPPTACSVESPQARDTRGAAGSALPAALSEGMQVSDFQGGGAASADEPPRQHGAGVWSSSASTERAGLEQAGEEWFSLSVASWNLAGAGKKKIKGIVTTVVEHDLVAVQEYPKLEVGWHVVDHGRMSAVLYQDVMMYRAVGIMYDKGKFRFRKRRRAARGVWVLLQHIETAREVWFGSVHLPVNEVVEEIDRFTDEFLGALPATDKPVLLLGDMNTHFTWVAQQGVVQPRHMHNRWSKLRQATVERGFSQVPPAPLDMGAPTFVPRRAGASSTQIDAIFAARCQVTPLQVEKDSRNEIGTDHERVRTKLLLKGVRQGKATAGHQAGGPRRVTSAPPPQLNIDDGVLQHLAATRTKPARLGAKFRMSNDTRSLQKQAKASRTAAAWKAYLSSLRREKDVWKTQRIEGAARDWGVYKQVCRTRKGWVEGYMVAAQSDTPEQDVVKHFTDVFHDAERPDAVRELRTMAEGIPVPQLRPFTQEEVREAFASGKACKAVGPDGVPVELLQAMMSDECSMQSFVSYFNAILASGKTPENWNQSVAVLLPKIPQPVQPKELRPIALASHTSKAFARMLLTRVEGCLMPKGAKQLACRGRQPTDLVWSAVRMVHLAREWGVEMHMIKLDLRRAFDSVYRVKLAERVQAWCQDDFPAETRCLISMLAAADLVLALPWGCFNVHSNTGVKQGATESPLLFGRLIDEVLNEIPFVPQNAVFPDLQSDGGCFMDDIIAWLNSVPALQQFLNALLPRLEAFGLFVQPLKCQLFSTKLVPGVHVIIDGKLLYPVPSGDPIMIMNLPVGVVATERHILEHLLDRARSKFHSVSHILCSRGPLHSRLRVLRTVVYGVMSWVVGALFPSRQLQQLLNHFECRCVRQMMGIKRGRDELWLDWEKRTMRLARVEIWRFAGQRWGDEFAKAFWTYTGHRVREGLKNNGSVVGILTNFRDLQWWRREQELTGGVRHPRHFPQLMNAERCISETVGTEDWRVTAANRSQWCSFLPQWLRVMTVPWTSGRQDSLPNV